MQSALRLTTCVQAGGKIEFSDVQLSEGMAVDVIVLFPPRAAGSRLSITEVLKQAPGQLAFKTADDVDAFLQQERQEWDR